MLENLNDLRAFVMVARTGSFTKAAGQLGVAQSALSYTIKKLEKQLEIKLLTRSTRSVAVTQAGEQLLYDIEPLMTSLDQKVAKLNLFRESIHTQGKLRINGTEYVISFLLWDKLSKFAKNYPNIQLEITTDYAFSDIVKERYDIGIRLGHHVAQDMIALPVTEPLEMVTVASPHYLKAHGIPQIPQDLYQHQCISLRLPSNDKVMPWEFNDINQVSSNNKNVMNINPKFSMIVSHARLQVKAVIDDLGISWLPKTMVDTEVKNRQLIILLKDWQMTYPPYYIYYLTRSESHLPLRLLIDSLRMNSSFLGDTT